MLTFEQVDDRTWICEPYKIRFYEYYSHGGLIEKRPHYSAYKRIKVNGKMLFGNHVDPLNTTYQTFQEAVSACERHKAGE